MALVLRLVKRLNEMNKALICGVSGQDGAYLAGLLIENGYEVIGGSRDAAASSFSNLKKLGIYEKVITTTLVTSDFRSVLQVLNKHQPTEIYNLAAQSSVGRSFEQPVETIESIAIGALNLLEAIRFSGLKTRFYNASSSECFGDIGFDRASEETPFKPRSPYAVAKVASHNLVNNYRDAYDLFACNGILFNHESSLRPEKFVTQKIIKTASRIAAGSKERLQLGRIDIKRDWGWAPDYVKAMWLMLKNSTPEDFVIATGKSVTLEYFVKKTFEYFDLNYLDYLTVDESLYRPSDIDVSAANPGKAKKILDWVAETDVDDVVLNMCRSAQADLVVNGGQLLT